MQSDVTTPTIRPGQDADAAGIISLIAACWSAYPGIVFDVDGEMPELRALASYYTSQGGALWIAEAGGSVRGMIATRPHEETLWGTAWEICRVYVAPGLHGAGLGHALLDTAEAHAITAGAERLVLWSDTRFERAHRFYEKRSYVRSGPIRILNDASNSLEFGYAKLIDGIMPLDAPAAASAEAHMAGILVACVNEGAGVSFLRPLSAEKAREYWRRQAKAIAANQCVLLAGWHQGRLIATGMLNLAMPENQSHRAEVEKILVHPSARRLGYARRMLLQLEDMARAAGRSLLVLDTRAGDGGEALYRAEGWQEYGRLAGHARGRDGELVETVFMAKWISEAKRISKEGAGAERIGAKSVSERSCEAAQSPE